jgi:CelD/BcsL family acetyltransferase involved in cellulose biosynthesis
MSIENLRITIEPISSISDLKEKWLDLQARSDNTFFTSWHWVGCWLEMLPPSIKPFVLQIDLSGKIVGLGVLIKRTTHRHGIISSRGLFLNTTGDPTYDELTIEYNGLCVDRTMKQQVIDAALEYLTGKDAVWDEIHLDGLCDHLISSQSPHGSKFLMRIDRQIACHYVDLDLVRLSGKAFIDSLGKSTRYNIRRTIRNYESIGAIELTQAKTVEEALNFLIHLSKLHQAHWISKGLPGSFANEFFTRFHQRLIRECFDKGYIQLLRIKVGNLDLGYLYGILYQGWNHHYQSGFNYADFPGNYSPGLVCQSFAIDHSMNIGLHAYDFMAGDTDYKKRMGNAERSLVWIVLQRKCLKFALENRLRNIKAGIVRKKINKIESPNSEIETTAS